MKIAIIPDTQVAPGFPTDHLRWAGQYMVEKRPDVIVHIGDHWDFPSLSSYDKGKKAAEGRRVLEDIRAGQEAMQEFLEPIRQEQHRLEVGKRKRWNPRLVFCVGNHEVRMLRHVEANPELEGMLSLDSLGLEEMGWEVYPFLEVVKIEGVLFSHYFTSGIMGRPVSNAKLLLDKKHMSAVMGHVQDCNVAFAKRGDGVRMTGIFAGIFYQNDFDYLGNQNNDSWRGLWMLHEVKDGAFDHMMVSMEYLHKKYGESK